MRKLAFWGSAVVAAILLGVALSVIALAWMSRSGGSTAGPWATIPATGSPEAGLYTRAVVALFGLLALSPQETIYFTATTDSAGEPLSGDCTYRLDGADLAARWWSITAYGPGSYLIANAVNRYSISQTTVTRTSDGRYTAWLAPSPQPTNWIPVKAGQRFDLTARLYNPDARVYRQPAATELPTITKERCQ